MTVRKPVAVLLLAAIAAFSQQPAGNKAAAIDALAASYVKAGKSPGLAVGVMQAGEVVLAKGYGLANLQDSAPVTPNTVFRISSMTKQFTAAGILLLAERGGLRTDDLLVKFLPDFPRASEISVKELLTHTAGLSTYDGKPEFRTFAVAPHNISQLVDWVRRDPFVVDPGTAGNYSNSGYLLLAAIVEKVSGQSFPAFMQRNIFDKLALTRTSIEDPKAVIADSAAGYMPRESGGYNSPLPLDGNGGGGTSCLSNVTDLLHWHDALFNGKLLKPASFAEMTKPARLNNGETAVTTTIMAGSHYGYGLILADYKGHAKIGHTGTGGGFHSIIMTYPANHFTIVILSNRNGRPAPIAGELEQAIADIMLDGK